MCIRNAASLCIDGSWRITPASVYETTKQCLADTGLFAARFERLRDAVAALEAVADAEGL